MDQILSVLVVALGAVAAFLGIAFIKKPRTSKTTEIARKASERIDQGVEELEVDRKKTEAALEEALEEVESTREDVKNEHDKNDLIIDNVTDFDGFTFRN